MYIFIGHDRLRCVLRPPRDVWISQLEVDLVRRGNGKRPQIYQVAWTCHGNSWQVSCAATGSFSDVHFHNRLLHLAQSSLHDCFIQCTLACPWNGPAAGTLNVHCARIASTSARHCYIGTSSWAKHDAVDAPWYRVQVYPILCEQHQLA